MKNEARKRGEFARSGTQAAVIHTWEGKKKLMPEKASTGKCWVLPHTKEQAGLGRLQTPEWSFAISTSTAAVGVLYNPKSAVDETLPDDWRSRRDKKKIAEIPVYFVRHQKLVGASREFQCFSSPLVISSGHLNLSLGSLPSLLLLPAFFLPSRGECHSEGQVQVLNRARKRHCPVMWVTQPPGVGICL